MKKTLTLMGTIRDSEEVYEVTIKNADLEATIVTYGAILKKLIFKGRKNKSYDVVLGYDELKDIEQGSVNAAVIGRVANRIAGGSFELGHVIYRLEKNEGNNTLHSASGCYGTKNFTIVDMGKSFVTLSYIDHGEAGFPGDVSVEVRYEITDLNELIISYKALPSQDTPINLTNHCYFNLSGDLEEDILNQMLKINADFYTPVDDRLIPTREIRRVNGTEVDFRSFRRIGDVLKDGFGLDHNLVINGSGIRQAAEIYSETSGIHMRVSTDQRGIQIYTANHLSTPTAGKGGRKYGKYAGICFETQDFPDMPNWKNHDPAVKANHVYTTKTIFEFSKL